MTTVADVDTTEYECLKQEQRERLGRRDGYVYYTLAAAGAVLYAVHESGRSDLLLAVPLPTLVLGWVFLMNDIKIVEIRAYVRDQLTPRLKAAANTTEPILGWEYDNRGPVWTPRRVGQLIANLALFILPAGVAIGTWATSGHLTIPLAALAVAEIVATVAVGWEFVRHARRRKVAAHVAPPTPVNEVLTP